MNIAVLVPRREDNGARDRMWAVLKSKVWESYEVVEGHHTEGPFNRSAALNEASRLAGEWDIAIIADADSFVPDDRLQAAIKIANDNSRLVIPHSRWVNVEEHEVSGFLNENMLYFNPKRDVYNTTVSSILVVPRRVWDTVNGFDERFQGWGWEDVAFMEAVTVLADGPIRLHGDVYHMAHDRPEADTGRMLDSGYIANRSHYRRYKLAKGPGEVRKLVSGNRVTL